MSSKTVEQVEMDAIMSRLSKVLNLQERAGTPEEAEAAAAAAQRLMFKHNIDMATIRKHRARGEALDEGIKYTKFDLGNLAADRREWKTSLFATISTNNFCRTVYMTGSTTAYIIGREDNIAAVALMYEYLVHTFERFRKQWIANNPYDEDLERFAAPITGLDVKGAPARATHKIRVRSYCLGLREGIARKLIEERRKNEGEYKGSSELVVVEDGKVQAAFDEAFKNMKLSGPGDVPIDTYEYFKGVKDGGSVSLARQVKEDHG